MTIDSEKFVKTYIKFVKDYINANVHIVNTANEIKLCSDRYGTIAIVSSYDALAHYFYGFELSRRYPMWRSIDEFRVWYSLNVLE